MKNKNLFGYCASFALFIIIGFCGAHLVQAAPLCSIAYSGNACSVTCDNGASWSGTRSSEDCLPYGGSINSDQAACACPPFALANPGLNPGTSSGKVVNGNTSNHSTYTYESMKCAPGDQDLGPAAPSEAGGNGGEQICLHTPSSPLTTGTISASSTASSVTSADVAPTGLNILWVQAALTKAGFFTPTFDAATQAAVTAFQKSVGVSPTGKVDSNTAALLNKILKAQTSLSSPSLNISTSPTLPQVKSPDSNLKASAYDIPDAGLNQVFERAAYYLKSIF